MELGKEEKGNNTKMLLLIIGCLPQPNLMFFPIHICIVVVLRFKIDCQIPSAVCKINSIQICITEIRFSFLVLINNYVCYELEAKIPVLCQVRGKLLPNE